MKRSKKTIPILSFVIGAFVFVSTAFADMMLGSGYDLLKNSAKRTAQQMESGLNNYTVEALLTFKIGDQTLFQSSMVNKFDLEKQASEVTTVNQNSKGETFSRYSYSDKTLSIWKNGGEDIYYVTEYRNSLKDNHHMFDNPFEEDGAQEIEKIVDAFVGSLKDYVQVEERAEGGRAFSGSLSEMQVPALVNAVSSYLVKQVINDRIRMEENAQIPNIDSDIFVKKITGTAVENKAGLLENVTGHAVLSGKDKNGVQHELTMNVVFKLTDVGSTKVAAPDLTNAKVEKVNQSNGLSSKYVGTYKNNIVIEKEGEFVKIGERVLEITSVDSGKVTGKYYETVKPEFAAEYPDPYNFTFEYQPDSSKPMSFFTYANPKGEQEYGQIHMSGSPGKIYLDLGIEIISENSFRSGIDHRFYDGEFHRVFEEE